MANYLLVRHRVKDFSTWKTAYDNHGPARTEAGLAERQLLQGADDPNDVTLLFEASDLGKAKEFATSDTLKDVMQEAGVVSQPDIAYLTGS